MSNDSDTASQTLRHETYMDWEAITGTNYAGKQKTFIFCPDSMDPRSYPFGTVFAPKTYTPELLIGHQTESATTSSTPFSGALPDATDLVALEELRSRLGDLQDAMEIFGSKNCIKMMKAMRHEMERASQQRKRDTIFAGG